MRLSKEPQRGARTVQLVPRSPPARDAGVVVLGAIMTILDTTFVAGTIATLLRKFGVSLPTT